MIILDLEWNRGYDRIPLEEILQIGAVRVDRPGGHITDTFHVFVRPQVHHRFDLGAKSLPDLQASRDSQTDFPTAMAAFRQWCGDDDKFALWGSGDLEALAQNCKYWKLPPLEPKTVHDLQLAFSFQVGTAQQVSLSNAVDYCRIPDLFLFHNALNDAMYTALVSRGVTQEALAYRPLSAALRRALRFSSLPFSPPPRRRVGPFQSPQEVLNAKESRWHACPLCGQPFCVTSWHFSSSTQYYAPCQCPEHGRFLCRLTLSQTPDGHWQGRAALPAITPELLQEYCRALQGQLHVCKGKRKRRRRRRRSPCPV